MATEDLLTDDEKKKSDIESLHTSLVRKETAYLTDRSFMQDTLPNDRTILLSQDALSAEKSLWEHSRCDVSILYLCLLF